MFVLITPRARRAGSKTLNSSTCRTSQRGERYVAWDHTASRLVYVTIHASGK